MYVCMKILAGLLPFITGVLRGHLAIIAILRNDVGGRGSVLATGLCMHGKLFTILWNAE